MSTICAIATAPGGAIGIIRICSPHAIIHATRIFHPACGVPLEERKPASLTFGTIVDPSTNEVVDEVLISLFRAPHSYTGEDAIEISCHGSSYILQRIMQLLIETYCRMATAGEYTKRAFLNGKMDLSEAEAVADLIASQDAATHRLAINQMRGGFGREFATLRNQLLHINTLLELELDFSDHEDIEFADRSTLNILATEIEKTIATLTQSFAQGNAIKNGVPVAIVGQTNAGKSTLLNTLLNEEKAIVSSIHGTTRDTIEDTFYLHGIRFRLIDTAGLRTTNDEIENIGINRTLQRISQSDIVAWIIDGTETLEKALCLYDEITSRITPKQWLIPIINKADLLSLAQQEALLTAFVTLPQAPTPHTPHSSFPLAVTTVLTTWNNFCFKPQPSLPSPNLLSL